MAARYVVAVRRECRSDAPAGWVDQVAALEGVTLVGGGELRIQVDAEPEAVARLEDAVGSFAHVEQAVEHRPLAPSDGEDRFRPV